MKFMSRNKNKMNSYRQSQYDSREFLISMTDRSYEALQLCDASLKIWLPENVMKMLYEITVLQDIPIADFIRQVFFVHLYGKYDLLGYIERCSFPFVDPDRVAPCAKTSDSADAVPAVPVPVSGTGNNVMSLKIPLPAAMKQGLLDLANKKYQPLSEYSRRLIITHLLGHQETYPTPPKSVEEE